MSDHATTINDTAINDTAALRRLGIVILTMCGVAFLLLGIVVAVSSTAG